MPNAAQLHPSHCILRTALAASICGLDILKIGGQWSHGGTGSIVIL